MFHIFYLINIDEMFKLFKHFNIFNKLKYLYDPLNYRSSYIILSTKFYKIFKVIKKNKKQYFLFFNFIKFYKIYLFTYIIFIFYKAYTLKIYFNKEKSLSFLFLFFKNLLIDKKFIKSSIIKYIKLILYYFNIILINMVYIILISLTNLIYSLINFLVVFKHWILYFILFFICLKYYWIIYYFFLILYKHYMFNFPLIEIKETSRFFNFEWIDIRNYYNLILYHNTLVDLAPFNNLIYNDLVNNLDKALYLYGFKIGDEYDISLFTLLDLKNKDTNLLNTLMSAYNTEQSYKRLEYYSDYKKTFNNEAQMLYPPSKADLQTPELIKMKQPLEAGMLNAAEQAEKAHLSLQNSPLTEKKKEELNNWTFFNKNYFRCRIASNQIAFNTVHFLKLKNIPLKYIHLYNKDEYTKNLIKIINYTDDICESQGFLRSIQLKIIYLYNMWKNLKIKKIYSFFFSQIYNFDEYKNLLTYKHKIPTYNWTSSRWRKKVPDLTYLDYIYLTEIEEEHPLDTYDDLAKNKVNIKKNYKYEYVYDLYPYNVSIFNENNNIIEVLNYYNILKNNIKVVKKAYFLYNSKIYYNKKHYTMLLEYDKLLVKFFLNRVKYLDHPFVKGHLYKFEVDVLDIDEDDNDIVEIVKTVVPDPDTDIKPLETENYLNSNFWFLFDYLKVDKYYYLKYPEIYKENNNYINLYFIKRMRKDYIRYRSNLIRLFSLYNYYYINEHSFIQHFWPDVSGHFKNDQIEEHFESLKLSWYLNIYLTNDRQNVELFKNLYFLSNLFKTKFWPYFIYCDYTINSHNQFYDHEIDTYKVIVLNKISNLKRFFFYNNKHILKSSILKYLNTFSLNFHIKHLLWHSPYSFIFYKNNFIINNDNEIYNKVQDLKLSYILKINKYKKIKIIKLNKYSLVFNLFLNINEIKKDWAYIINTGNIDLPNNIIFYKTYYHYYYNGKFNFKTLHYMDLYRFLMNLIYYYYNNFLYKLARYHYILDYKNYTVYSFLKRYFNFPEWFWHQFIRMRLQIYRYLFYGKFIKRGYYTYFKLKNLYAARLRRIELIPFWFIFDSYIKMFVYFILKKYYTKNFFIIYWFNFILDYKLLYCIMSFYYLKYALYVGLKNVFLVKLLNNYFIFSNYLLALLRQYKNVYALYYKHTIWETLLQGLISNFILSIQVLIVFSEYRCIKISQNFLISFIIKLISKFLLLIFYFLWQLLIIVDEIVYTCSKSDIIKLIKWYILLISQYNFNFLFSLDYIKIKNLFKFYFLGFNIRFNIKLNNLILIKLYFEKLLVYYYIILFNVKNALVYFKPNYYFFREQVNVVKSRDSISFAFTSTNTLRSIESFKHFTYNITFIKNIYLINIYNYIYLLNSYDITYENVFNLIFFLFKYNYIYYTIIYYMVLYWIILFFLFLYYKKFYNIFFFCNPIKNWELQDHWNKIWNDEAIKLSCVHTKKKHKMYNFIWKKFKWYNFYKFNIFNVSFKKTKIQEIIYKSFLLNKLYVNKIYKLLNNNTILDYSKENLYNRKLKKLDYSVYLFNFIKYFKNIHMLPIVLKKEKKEYNFFFLNLFNQNLINFCALYWLIMIPFFFLDYILIRYHLRGHLRTKRAFIVFVKIFLNNFKIYVKLFKLIGDGIYTNHKVRYPKNYYNSNLTRKKKKMRFGYFLKWDRYQQLLFRITPLGAYYYWFFNINRVEYILYFAKYYFVSCFFSNYFHYVYLYAILLMIFLKKFKLKQIFKFNFIYKNII